MKLRTYIVLLLILLPALASAQDWMRVHRTYGKVNWNIPLRVDSTYYDIADGYFQGHYINKLGDDIMVPWAVSDIDSIDFVSSLTDEQKGHNHYRVFSLYIDTQDQMGVQEHDTWVYAHFSLDGKGEYSDYSGTGRIRGRGNSSWDWYDKKPYKFKLDYKSKLLGLDKAKDWNLLANYRDVTDLMNALAFETARYMGMPNTLHSRYVEVFLDGEYIGLYQLTEKIEVDNSRLDLDRNEGLLLSLDLDDGPSLSPDDGDNFWTQVFKMPMTVKYPDEPSAEKLDSVKADFAILENAIKTHNYALVDSLMDIPSFISYLQLHEYLYNVEIDAPRSMYLYRDKGGKYVWGPAWDWDAGFDFDWGDMYTGHRFFSDYRELIYGTDPYNNKGAAYRVNDFFTEMFANSQFVTQYKEQWNAVKDSLYLIPWAKMEQWVENFNQGTLEREFERWPIYGYTAAEETSKMSAWLQNRLEYLNGVIANYPDGDSVIIDTEVNVVGTVQKKVHFDYWYGYSQYSQIEMDEERIVAMLGGEPTALVPLNADGTEGQNTAAKTYGAWFDADGNTNSWGSSHIYIESDDLYTWNYGCHPDNCADGHEHTVTMQYRYATSEGTNAVNVILTFTTDYVDDEDIYDDTTDGEMTFDDEGNILITKSCSFSDGYHQSGTLEIDQTLVEEVLGGSPTALVALNADGSEGSNTAGKTYGAWFDASGNTRSWNLGHVFIESDDLYSWSYGCHPSNCAAGDTHTVTMQYQYTSGGTTTTQNVIVTFNITD